MAYGSKPEIPAKTVAYGSNPEIPDNNACYGTTRTMRLIRGTLSALFRDTRAASFPQKEWTLVGMDVMKISVLCC